MDEPQFFSMGAALLGLIQHYLLVRAESKTGAFIMGMLSQFVLLGTTYIEMLNKSELIFAYFLVLVLPVSGGAGVWDRDPFAQPDALSDRVCGAGGDYCGEQGAGRRSHFCDWLYGNPFAYVRRFCRAAAGENFKAQ